MEHLFLYPIYVQPDRAVTYLVGARTDNSVFVVDPGQPFSVIRQTLEMFGKTCGGILLTHGHFDHIESLDSLSECYNRPVVYLHGEDSEMLRDAKANVSYIFGEPFTAEATSTGLSDGQEILLDGLTVRVIATPGHTRGSVCFLCTAEDESLLLSGDTLFQGNVGRWDFPGGDEESLRHSLRRLTDILPETLCVYPGHGDSTTIGREKRQNYFIRMG